MGTYFVIAIRNLAQARRRTLLLGAALAAVTGLFALLLALSAGISDALIRSATTLATGHVNVAGFFKARASDAAPVVREVTALRALVQSSVDGLDLVVDRGRGFARIVGPDRALQAGLTGIDVAEERRLFEMLRFAPEAEYLDGGRDEIIGDPRRLESGGAILFSAQARRLGVRVGDPLTLVAQTLQGQTNSAEVTVAAVAKDIGFLSNFSVFVGKSTLRTLYRLGPDVSGVVQIYLQDHRQAPAVMGKLRDRLSEAGYELMPHEPTPFFAKFGTVSGEAWTGERLDTSVWTDEVSFLGWVLAAVDAISVTLVSILVAIIAVGIMNSMRIAVRERTREIGTLRAIGMSRRRVLRMFLLEALLLSVIGTAAGAVLGALLALGLDAAQIPIPVEAVRAILMSDTLHLVVEPGRLAVAVVAFTAVTALSSVWPALAASRLEPVTAMHHVG